MIRPRDFCLFRVITLKPDVPHTKNTQLHSLRMRTGVQTGVQTSHWICFLVCLAILSKVLTLHKPVMRRLLWIARNIPFWPEFNILSERRILYKIPDQTDGFMIENYTLNIPKNYILCEQVIGWSVTVNCLQLQKTPITWTNTALQYTVKHTQFFETSSRANISESLLIIHKTGVTHGIKV
jgi:hypothetical protein